LTERFIKQADGLWTVCVRVAPDSFRSLSFHDRRADALARVTTILSRAGGGRWVVMDKDNREVEAGDVAISEDPAAAHS
jgi:hypothetical protein